MSAAPAIVALTSGGLELAERLKRAMPDAKTHGLVHRVDGADVSFDNAMTHIAALFGDGTPIVGICASGILIRAIAPLLADKHHEPPVIAVAEDASAVVPLLGGHKGANRLAREVADALGTKAAVTTAGDVAFGLAIDDPPAGWSIANPEVAKSLVAARLAGHPVQLEVDAGDAGWLTGSGMTFSQRGSFSVRVTDRADLGNATTLVLHPPTLAVGVGCERCTDPDELTSLVEAALAEAGLATSAVAAVVSLDVKADEPAVHRVAARFGVPARFFDAARLEAETPRLASPSDYVYRTVGCHGVAEGAALAAGGGDGDLIVPKTRSERATCAIVRAAQIDGFSIGRPQGRLTILGTGPGDAAYRAPAADIALESATDIVGYHLYTGLLGSAGRQAHRHEFALGEETARCRHALDLAAEGGQVVLVSSGDPGIYAMAALVFELLDTSDTASWSRIAIDVIPGISAMQYAAARAGAPLGHDFCTISLSDLLTPWPTIEARIRAAAEADFVIAFYNPVSRRRQSQLAEARDILLQNRSQDTPVVVARNLARAGEQVEILPLSELDPAQLDMLSLVIVGSTASRAFSSGTRRWVFTPRGYDPEIHADTPRKATMT